MQQPDRLVKRCERKSSAQLRRHGVLDRPGVKRLEHLATQAGLTDARRRGIHGREGLRQRLVALDEPIARVRHLRAEQSAANLAEGPYVQALLYGLFELLELGVAEVEEAQHQPFGVHDELPLTAKKDRRALYTRLHQYWVPGWGRVKRSKDCLVLVAQRQMQDEVEPGSQSQLVELRAFHPACRMASISTSAPRGSPATPTAARDG